MNLILKTLTALALLLSTRAVLADAPGAQFYVIDTKILLEVVKSTDEIDQLSSSELEEMCEISGSVLNFQHSVAKFKSKTFRISISFRLSTPIGNDNTESMSYCIAAGGPKDWSTAFLDGDAIRYGNSYIDPSWKSKPKTVVIRFLNFKR